MAHDSIIDLRYSRRNCELSVCPVVLHWAGPPDHRSCHPSQGIVTIDDMISLLGNGVYSIPDAARFTRLETSRVREWFRGRSKSKGPLFVSDYQEVTERKLLSFFDLIEVFIAGQLRQAKVTMPTVRKVHANLQQVFGVEHPFCHQEICLHGKTVLTRGLDQRGEEEIRDAVSRQKVFPEIIKPFLKSLDYDGASRLAAKWHIAHAVVINPQICFGQPVAERAGVPTRILAKSYSANGQDAGFVAQWFGVSTEDVNAAVAFESSLAA
jgi:uncharacterized protein (DUF433 family)